MRDDDPHHYPQVNARNAERALSQEKVESSRLREKWVLNQWLNDTESSKFQFFLFCLLAGSWKQK